jgi:hypothetical protein
MHSAASNGSCRRDGREGVPDRAGRRVGHGSFEPERLEETCRALAEAQKPPLEEDGRNEAARRSLADCDARLARYRTALEAGTDPTVVSQWISEVQAERRTAEEELRRRRPTAASQMTTSG